MTDIRQLDDQVRDRALELELETLRHPDDRSIARRAGWSSLLVAAAGLVVLVITLVDRETAPGADAPDAPQREPAIIRTRAEAEALPADTEAVITIDADEPTLRALARLRRLRRVVLERTPELRMPNPVTAMAWSENVSPLGALASVASLRRIELADGDRITADAVAALERLPVLEGLEVRPPRRFVVHVPDAVVAALGRLALTDLAFGPQVILDDAAIRRLGAVRGLRRLALPLRSSHSMDAILTIRELRSLRELSLRPDLSGGAEPTDVLDDRLVELVSALPDLEHLEVATADGVSTVAWTAIARARPWRSFTVENARALDVRALRALPSTVRSLALGDGVADGALEAGLPGDGASLERLHLRFRDDAGANWILAVDALPALRELDLEAAARFDSTAIGALPSRAPALRILRLRMGPHLDAAAIGAIADLPSLRELDLSGSAVGFSRLSPFGPLQIVGSRRVPELHRLAKLSRLGHLVLDHCAAIPVAELRALAKLPLRHLSLRGTPIAFDQETADLDALRVLWPGIRIDT